MTIQREPQAGGAPVPHPVYCDLAALRQVVGDPNGQDERLQLALILGSRWVDHTLGYYAADGTDAIPAVPIEYPLELAYPAVDPRVVNATLVAATRMLRSGDVPLGVMGGLGDFAVRIRSEIPEAEMQLMGMRDERSWGVG